MAVVKSEFGVASTGEQVYKFKIENSTRGADIKKPKNWFAMLIPLLFFFGFRLIFPKSP